MAVDHLHVLGDIYDRGAGSHLIMDRLCKYHSLDIQWGNHDILWMGAAAGSMACIATVLNISMQYNNLNVIENSLSIFKHNTMLSISKLIAIYHLDYKK